MGREAAELGRECVTQARDPFLQTRTINKPTSSATTPVLEPASINRVNVEYHSPRHRIQRAYLRGARDALRRAADETTGPRTPACVTARTPRCKLWWPRHPHTSTPIRLPTAAPAVHTTAAPAESDGSGCWIWSVYTTGGEPV